MSLNKKNREPRFSLYRSRTVPIQPTRNINLENIENNNNNNDDYNNIIIISKDKLPELEKKFTYIQSYIDVENVVDTRGNFILRKSFLPREYNSYSYFPGVDGDTVNLNTESLISRNKLWSLLPGALHYGYVPKRYIRILRDYLGDTNETLSSDEKLLPRQKLYPRPDSRAQLKKTRRVYKSYSNNNNSNNINNNNNNENGFSNIQKNLSSQLLKKHKRRRRFTKKR